MKIIYNTGRYYGIEQLIHLVVDTNEIKFSDHARNIHGTIKIDKDKKELIEEFYSDSEGQTIKEYSKFFMDHYDLGKYEISQKEIHLDFNRGYKLNLVGEI